MAHLHHPAVHFLVSGLCRRSYAGEGAPAHRRSELYRNMLFSHQNQGFFHPHCTYETCEREDDNIHIYTVFSEASVNLRKVKELKKEEKLKSP